MKKSLHLQKSKTLNKMPNMRTLVSFDWAMKKILRNKANFDIVEGFLSELLRREVKIKNILESESNKESESDKQNRVDILAENESGEIVIIEVQFAKEVDYFHRMIYGVCKSLTERIKEGMSYKNAVKIYSVNIVYFNLGEGDDYAYHGTTSFSGMYNRCKLNLTNGQKKVFSKEKVEDIFPEYYILDVSKFDDVAKDPLAEWMYYLKNYKIEDSFNARGLRAAGEKLKYNNLSESEQRAYDRKVHYDRVRLGEIETALFEGEEEGLKKGLKKGLKEGRKEGIKEGTIKIAKKMLDSGMDIKDASALTNLALSELKKLQKQ
jgi:predicted transposase/invertase (TIGR01784 family)